MIFIEAIVDNFTVKAGFLSSLGGCSNMMYHLIHCCRYPPSSLALLPSRLVNEREKVLQHHTFELEREREGEGLVVDEESILIPVTPSFSFAGAGASSASF